MHWANATRVVRTEMREGRGEQAHNALFTSVRRRDGATCIGPLASPRAESFVRAADDVQKTTLHGSVGCRARPAMPCANDDAASLALTRVCRRAVGRRHDYSNTLGT